MDWSGKGLRARFRPFALMCCVLFASQLLAGCSAPVTAARADTRRDLTPDAPPDEVAALVGANQAFAFDLYHALSSDDGNIIASPYSISMALSMVYGGAKNATADQMAGVLHFTLPQDRLHPAVNRLDQMLMARANSGDPDKPDFQLNVTNGVWGEKGYTFKPDYLTLLAQDYGAGIHLVDFKGSPDPSREAINRWVSDRTKDKIKDLFAPGTITPNTRLVLANAIYFYGKWVQPFDTARTHDGDFTLLDGSKVRAQMMSREKHALYAAGDGYQAVSLAYWGADGPAMLIILPEQGRFADFEKGLDADRFNQVLASLSSERVILSMPRFMIESSFSLADQLSALGMPDAFDSINADFTGMATIDPIQNLYISKVVHKAYISVVEDGTEAGAATGAVGEVTSAIVQEPPRMQVDHPFLFAIYDRGTGEILFLGRVLNPAG